MKLIVQPDSGVAPIVAAIKRARKSVEIAIFRFEHKAIEAALNEAAARGVRVTALIAFVNRGGEKSLRKLEMRLLDAGIIVARTADDLIRYHGKYILIDRRVLYVLSFNFTRETPKDYGTLADPTASRTDVLSNRLPERRALARLRSL